MPGAKAALPSAETAAPPGPIPRAARKAKATPQKLTPVLTVPSAAPARKAPVAILDSGWEKRIRGGTILPDMTVDLHDHSLAAAHVRLDQVIEFALRQDARILLVVTGKPRKRDGLAGPASRGAIRAEIGDWLARGRHAGQIASVRTAHPRHGGDGALYIILRRKRPG